MAFRRASAPEPVQTTRISAGHEPASRRRVETKSRQRAYGNLARNCRITIGPNADDGYPVRDQGSASYIATFEPAAVFGDLVKAEGIRRGAGHVRQLTILGDGAAWIWNIATDKFPEATQIVDLFHAREHLYDLARLLEFMLLDRTDEWLTARMEDLDYGDIDGICQAARLFPLEGIKKDQPDTALGYFENNAPPHALQLVPL